MSSLCEFCERPVAAHAKEDIFDVLQGLADALDEAER